MQNPDDTPPQDAERFRRLLDLIGPEGADSFRAQLLADLDDCGATIARGADSRDWPALRGASHVLISLAGAAGATALMSLARELNAAAQGRDAATVDRLRPALVQRQADLAALVQSGGGAA